LSKIDNESSDESEYEFRLYITGATEHSMLAVKNIKQFCEEYLAKHYKLEIIDIYQQPSLAEKDQITATPTLFKLAPLPTRQFIGDMRDKHALVVGLNISHE
jgi:circadian clock protein KaiB